MHKQQRISRRTLLRSAALGGSGLVAAYLLGCGDGAGDAPGPTATSQPIAPAEPTAAPTLRWRRRSPTTAPPPRRDHSLVTDGQRLYLFAGRNDGELADLWISLAGNEWAEVPSGAGPAARHGHNAVWDAERGRMVIFGGQSGAAFFDDVWAFDPATSRWQQLAATGSVPAARYGAGGAFDPAAGGRMLVTHGFTTAGRFDDTWQFSLGGESWSEISPAGERPIERCLMRAAWDATAERLLIFGGQTTNAPFLGDLWALEPGGWRELVTEAGPSPRNLYATVFDGRRRLLLFGGRTEDGPTNDLWAFSSPEESWSQPLVEGEAPPARFAHDAVWLPDAQALFVFGGSDGEGELNDLWELSAPA